MREPHELLEAELNRRRLELRLSWEGLADLIGVSSNHLRKVRRGVYLPRELGRQQIEDALGWPHGTIDDIIASVEDDAESDDDIEQWLDALYAQSKRTKQPVEDIIADIARAARENPRP